MYRECNIKIFAGSYSNTYKLALRNILNFFLLFEIILSVGDMADYEMIHLRIDKKHRQLNA